MKWLNGHERWYVGEPKKQIEWKRISRWITVQHNYNPNKHNSLWDYVQDGYGYRSCQSYFDPIAHDGLYLDYFRFNGHTYALEQFVAIGSVMDGIGHYMTYHENNRDYAITGWDIDGGLCDPLYCELSSDGEQIRLYERVY